MIAFLREFLAFSLSCGSSALANFTPKRMQKIAPNAPTMISAGVTTMLRRLIIGAAICSNGFDKIVKFIM